MNSESLTKLAEKKLPLVQADYESYFAAASRVLERINQLHTMEITVLAAFIALSAQKETMTPTTALPIYGFIFLFAILDASQRAGFRAINRDVLAAERKLQETDPEQFARNIVEWKFGNMMASRRNPSKRFREILHSLFYPGVFMWHGALAVAVFAFVWLIQ